MFSLSKVATTVDVSDYVRGSPRGSPRIAQHRQRQSSRKARIAPMLSHFRSAGCTLSARFRADRPGSPKAIHPESADRPNLFHFRLAGWTISERFRADRPRSPKAIHPESADRPNLSHFRSAGWTISKRFRANRRGLPKAM